MVAVIGINAVLGFIIPNVAWEAHLGGLIAGGLMALGLAAARNRRSPAIAWGAIGGVLLVVIGLWLGKSLFAGPVVPIPFA